MKIDTTNIQFEMYKQLNWIPVRFFFGYNKNVNEMPSVILISDEEWELMDRNLKNPYYTKRRKNGKNS